MFIFTSGFYEMVGIKLDEMFCIALRLGIQVMLVSVYLKYAATRVHRKKKQKERGERLMKV